MSKLVGSRRLIELQANINYFHKQPRPGGMALVCSSDGGSSMLPVSSSPTSLATSGPRHFRYPPPPPTSSICSTLRQTSRPLSPPRVLVSAQSHGVVPRSGG